MPDAPEVPRDGADDDRRGDGCALATGPLAAPTSSSRSTGRAPTDPLWCVPTSADFAFRLLDPASADGVALVSPFWADIWERGANWILQAGQYEYTPDHRPFVGADARRRLLAERRLERPRRDGHRRWQPAPDRRDHGPPSGPSWGLRAEGRKTTRSASTDRWRPAGTTCS